ncbi:MAG: peptidylprolyl isomerase [Micavibrio sp.]|nr:MAG: peptidylprolyl isomerase [Micavibrio sp.]
MAMQSLRKGASTGLLKYFLLGLLVFAAGGLVMTDVGGFFRGGISRTDIGKAGGEKINISAFDRTVRRTLGRIGIAPEEAFKLGYIDELLNNEIRISLMHQSASKLGVRVGKDHTANKVRAIVEPMVQDGNTPQQVLDQVLMSQGMSEGEFVNAIGREVGTSLLKSALQNGLAATSPSMAADIHAFQNEQRSIDLVLFSDKELKDIKKPSGAQLVALYEALKENYSQAETRTVTLVEVNSDKLKKTIDISEEEIRAAYDENIDAYTSPQQRNIEQSILQSEEEANAVSAALKAGGTLKAAVKKITGEDSAYLKAQPFEKDGLLPEISDLAFTAKKGEQIGPVQTALGWHVLVVKDIINPTKQSFQSVRKELEEELKQVRLADQLYELANMVDDLLAGGATLEEVKQEVDIETKSLPPFNSYGQGKDSKDALTQYEDRRTLIVETTYELLEGETSPVMETADGGFMAIHINSIQPKSYTPFKEVESEIKERWTDDQRRLENKIRVSTFLSEIETTNKSLKDFAREKGKSVKSYKNIKRQGEPKKPLTQRAMNIIFAAPVDGYALVDTTEGSAIAAISSFSLPTVKNQKEDEIKKLNSTLTSAGQNEASSLYLNNKQESFGVVVNRELLSTLYGPGRESF